MKKLSVVTKQLLSSALTFVTLMAPLQVNQSHTEAGDDPSQRINVRSIPIVSNSRDKGKSHSQEGREVLKREPEKGQGISSKDGKGG